MESCLSPGLLGTISSECYVLSHTTVTTCSIRRAYRQCIVQVAEAYLIGPDLSNINLSTKFTCG